MEGACSRFVLLFVLINLAVIQREALAAKHAVGGSQGWDESTNFDSWASSQTFKVGDQLEFKYTPGLHSVVELPTENAYKSCDISSSLDSLNGGSNTIKLDKVGTRYFACGTSGHCDQGMKVKITTVAADASPTTTTTQPLAPPTTTTTQPSASAAAHSTHHLQFLSFFALIASLLLSLVFFV